MHRRLARLALLVVVVVVAGAVVLRARRHRNVGEPQWVRAEAMVPTRDGTRLYTVLMIPRGVPGALPILLIRTPYGATGWGETDSTPPAFRELAADGYVFAFQDIRGRYRSDGEFVMNRPLRPPGDTVGTDEATDAWDAVDWLVKNVPNNNGHVGIFGVSYPGWLAEVPLVYPHPALKAVSPQAPMTDTWMGDDFFHQGAFRLSPGFEYAWLFESEEVGLSRRVPVTGTDTYEWYLSFPNLAALTSRTDAIRMPTWRRFVEHPAYDSVWRRRAFQRSVRGVPVPSLNVGGWWDQEDLFGPMATYEALERFDTAGLNVLVMGPWRHNQWTGRGGDSLGNLGFGGPTADWFRAHVQAPWFRYWLKGQGDGHFPEALLFDAGTDRWRTFDRWPPPSAEPRSLYLRADHRLSFEPPPADGGWDGYVSDPAHPVPYQPRPIGPLLSAHAAWTRWMTEDQRFLAARKDVVSWTSEALPEDLVVAGPVTARIFATTTGSDADWVVKLIDVYPDSGVAESMRGYQLMIAGEILRGRYRRSFERPEPIPPNVVEPYTVDLRPQFHTFRRGHRIQVQIQSSWFPLYDRNPQTFVPNIFEAPASAYLPRAHRIVRTATAPSSVEVMVLPR